MNCSTVYETGLLYHHYANTAYPLTPRSFMQYKLKDESEIRAFVEEEWQKAEELSLYIHVPFCKRRCRFCEYVVLEDTDEDAENEYVELLLIEKLEEWIGRGKPFAQIEKDIEEYKKHTGLVFMLVSLKNFAANGRVSPEVAKIAGVLGIRVVGKASDKGTLEPTNKCRGQEKSLAAILSHLKEQGLKKGKVWIAHCENLSAAHTLRDMILAELSQVCVKIHGCRGLCSYYAEKGGLLVGFEKC